MGELAAVAWARIERHGAEGPRSSRNLVRFTKYPLAHETAELERGYARRLAGLDLRDLRRGRISAPAQRNSWGCSTRQDFPDRNRPERWIYPMAAADRLRQQAFPETEFRVPFSHNERPPCLDYDGQRQAHLFHAGWEGDLEARHPGRVWEIRTEPWVCLDAAAPRRAALHPGFARDAYATIRPMYLR